MNQPTNFTQQKTNKHPIVVDQGGRVGGDNDFDEQWLLPGKPIF